MRTPYVDFAPDSDQARSVEAALASKGMLWAAEFKPLFLENPDSLGGIEQVDSHRALVRSDSGALLGVHGSSYTPGQQLAVFGGLQPLLDSGEARIVRAGQTQGGRKVYLEAEIQGARAAVKLGDIVRQVLVFRNCHDGSGEAQVLYKLERLACLNGMTRSELSKLFRGRHTQSLTASLDNWRVEFGEQRAAMDRQVQTFQAFARRSLNRRALTAYVREVLSPGAGADDSITVRGVDRIVELAHTAPGADPGTLWGGLNAITYWATHERGRTEDTRITNNVFGTGGAMLERATLVATQIVDKLPTAELGRASYENHATAKAELDNLLGRAWTPSWEREPADAE